ncbi:Endonuclease_I [Hexamita inflata]|nr:Endonuclease I [Hexamita inflata]
MAHPPTAVDLVQYQRRVEVQGNKNPFLDELNLTARAYCDLSVKYPCSKFQ